MKANLIIFVILLYQNAKSINKRNNDSTYIYNQSKNEINSVLQYGIKDGWYEAIVKYENYSTGTNSTYRLDVKVEYNSIKVIDFGNGGSVHSGINNEGYLYTGGYLSFEKDYEGNIIAATSTVTVSDKNGMRCFKIRIE